MSRAKKELELLTKKVAYADCITGEGTIIRTMSDGSVYTFRENSADGTSVIDINGNNSGKKSQKIHFID